MLAKDLENKHIPAKLLKLCEGCLSSYNDHRCCTVVGSLLHSDHAKFLIECPCVCCIVKPICSMYCNTHVEFTKDMRAEIFNTNPYNKKAKKIS